MWMPSISMQKAEPSRMNFFPRAKYFRECYTDLPNIPEEAPEEPSHEDYFLVYCFFSFFSLLKVALRQSGKYCFFSKKFCWASSSTAVIRHCILSDLDDQGLNKTCAVRTSSFTSSKLCQASGIWF